MVFKLKQQQQQQKGGSSICVDQLADLTTWCQHSLRGIERLLQSVTTSEGIFSITLQYNENNTKLKDFTSDFR